jgi:hypothetical protein
MQVINFSPFLELLVVLFGFVLSLKGESIEAIESARW